MEIYILDQGLNRIGVVDIYESFMWQPTYNDGGSFELHCGLKYFNLLQAERIVQNSEDDYHDGLIEYIEKTTDDEGVEGLLVKGRMLDVLLSRRIVLGTFQYYTKQPAYIISDLIAKSIISPADPSRAINNFAMGRTPDSNLGTLDYGGTNADLYEESKMLCKSSQLGLQLYADIENKKFVFDMYKGENRTEAQNTTTDVSIAPINNLFRNGNFVNGLAGWNTTPYGVTAAAGVFQKEKILDKYWESTPTSSNPDAGHWVYFEQYAGYVTQNVNLNPDHIYYFSSVCSNPTGVVLEFGIKQDGKYVLNVAPNTASAKVSSLIVPETLGTYEAAIAYGDLVTVGDKAYVYSAMFVDLTDTFGTGNEPNKEWCDRCIYFDGNSLVYRKEVLRFIDNPNAPLVFSRDRDNVLTTEYTKDITNEATFLYVQGADGVTTTLDLGNTGLTRKEAFLDLSSIPRNMDGVEIPLASYLAILKQQARAHLAKLIVSEMVENSIYTLSNFKYKKDYNLGDIVTCLDNKIGFSVDLRITEVTEVWDTNGYSLAITFGDNTPDLYDTIKLVAKGAIK